MRKKKELFIPAVTLKPGAMGLAVYNLQLCLDHILKEKGKRKLTDHEPGHYGPMTEQRVREFQSKYGLFVNGVILMYQAKNKGGLKCRLNVLAVSQKE